MGTRGLHEPYQVQLNGYQNVCNGCFAPFPYQRPLDQRFGTVTEFQTGANSIYNGLQTAYTQQWGGLTLRGNYTFSHCLDEVSNGGLLAFSTQGLESPLPGELSRQYASCDYDVRHNISAFGMYQVPFHSGNPLLRQAFRRMVVFGDGIPSLRAALQRAEPAVQRERQWRPSGIQPCTDHSICRAELCEPGPRRRRSIARLPIRA